MITNNPAQLKKILGNLEPKVLARHTGFSLREARKIDTELFLISFLQMIICGRFSLRLWANNLSLLSGTLISFQAIAKKLDFRQEPFFQALFQHALLNKIQQRINFQVHDILRSFHRVLIEDSTCFKLPASLFEFFPGAQLPHGRKSGGRLQVRIELKGHQYDAITFQSYCQNDQSFAGDILPSLQKGDLIIRDLGYWSIPVFDQIIRRKAFFLSRLKLNTNILCPATQEIINMVNFLKKKERHGIYQLDMPVLLSEKYRLPVRLVAIKLQKDQIEKRRRMAKLHRHKDTPISAKAYYLMTWNLFISNVDESVWDLQSVYRTYNLRWYIEMIFKCWKSKFKFESYFKHCNGRNPAKPEIILLLILTAYILLFMSYYNKLSGLIWRRYRRILSPLRFADFLATRLCFLDEQSLKLFLPFLAYHSCYDKRKDRLNHFEKIYINLLS